MSFAKRLCGPIIAFFFMVVSSDCEPLASITLWPDGAPGETNNTPEHDITKPTDRLSGGLRITRIADVHNPTITIHPSPSDKSTGIGVIVCPGGGYNYLAIDIEGNEICDWLNSIGVTGILLQYRVPARDRPPRTPLQDIQRAFGIVRHNAKQWGLDPHRIGAIGFSAGANLSALLSAHYATRNYTNIDEADLESCRPDFQLLIYPGGMLAPDDKLKPEFAVTTNIPPSFIVQAENDSAHVENALAYALALKQARVPAEFHMYADGGHGYGLRHTGLPIAKWPERADEWIKHHEEQLPQGP